ncbi:MAG: hypothetical protein ABI321_06160 [Polyangia bacterium]
MRRLWAKPTAPALRILDGLKVGDRVVTEGARFLKQELYTNLGMVAFL